MPNPRRRAEDWDGVLPLLWPSICQQWRRVSFALPHALRSHGGDPDHGGLSVDELAGLPALGDYPARHRLVRVEVYLPGPRRRKSKVAIGLVDPAGPGGGEEELYVWLAEVLGSLPVPTSGNLEIALSTVGGHELLSRWRRRVAIGVTRPSTDLRPPSMDHEPHSDLETGTGDGDWPAVPSGQPFTPADPRPPSSQSTASVLSASEAVGCMKELQEMVQAMEAVAWHGDRPQPDAAGPAAE